MSIKKFAGTVRGTGGYIKIGIPAVGGGGGGGFSPASLSGLVAWYDASAITGVSNGATLSSWSDLSANGNTLNSIENTPTYNSTDALLNNKSSVTYNGPPSGGADSIYRLTPTGFPVGSAAHTTYVVAYWDGSSVSGDEGKCLFSWGNQDDLGTSFGVWLDDARPAVAFFNNGGFTKYRGISAGSPFIFSFAYVAGSSFSSATTYLNGVADTGASTGGSTVTNIPDPVPEIGIGKIAGYFSGDPTYRWTGGVAELIVYNVTHTATERGQVTSYLSSKYGISVV